MKKSSLPVRLIPTAVILLALAALLIFVFIPIYSQEDVVVNADLELFSNSSKEKAYTLENDALLFTMDAASTQFTVQNKATGYTWYSNPPGADGDTLALSAEKDRLKSTLVLTYGTEAGVTALFNSYTYSVANGMYDIEKTDDAVRVRYTLGKISKVYRMPTAITEERMAKFTEPMQKSAKRTIDSQYRLYDINNLKKNDDKDALLAAYPDLAEMNLYILRDGTQEHQKKKIEASFIEAGYTAEDFEIDQQHVPGASIDDKPVFNLTVEYRLDRGDLVVTVPFDEIRYNAAYLPSRLSLLPFFGAADADDNGYMLLPDGGGAILKYNNGKLAQNAYYANVYGWDYGDQRLEVVNETRAVFPAFGMTGGDNAFLCMLEDGASYAAIQGDISGHSNMFNTANATYTLLHSEPYEVSAKTTISVYMFEKTLPEGERISQRYRFIDTVDYVDMAIAYREYLLNRYPALAPVEDENAPLMIEIVGAIDKTVQRAGLPVSRPMPVTTFGEAGAIVDDALAAGITNMTVRYTGWSNGGVRQTVLTNVNAVKALGGEKGIRSFISSAKARGVDVYVDGVSQFAYDSGLFEGFIPFRDAARFVTQERAELYEYHNVWFGEKDFDESHYLVKPEFMLAGIEKLRNAAAELDAAGLAFRDVGFLLSADYNKNARVSREESMRMQVNALNDMDQQGQKVIIRKGNEYALPYAELITDMDLRGCNFSILDALVPFYQIALHGYVNYTGSSVNLSPDYGQAILEAAEYGAGLSFTFMKAETQLLRDTKYTDLFGAQYDLWKNEAYRAMKQYQSDTAGLNNQKITGHKRLTNTLTVTAYEDGTRVYVNYGERDAQADGVTVAARTYRIAKGE